jgi:2-polyprenyl-3-methyl-5-hydroxy-6-metoxy-1,4-benzoquinol methylase
MQSLYENYHKQTGFQRKLIGRKNFTYCLILNTLEPYLGNKQKVLDIGCGAGTLSFYIANKGNFVMGVDISSRAIKICNITAKKLGLGKAIVFEVGDFLKSKIRERVDLILCCEVLEHLVDDKIAIKKIFNDLKDGGILFITVPSKNAPLLRLGALKRFDRNVGHLRRYSKEQLIILLEDAGFSILKIKKTEGVLRNYLFINWTGNQIVRFANRFGIVADVLTFLDNITLKLFGESQIIVVAKKVKK